MSKARPSRAGIGGQMKDGVPEPVTGRNAEQIAAALAHYPAMASTIWAPMVLIIAPSITIETGDGIDARWTIAEAVAWNFWPRIDTGGAQQHHETPSPMTGERSVP